MVRIVDSEACHYRESAFVTFLTGIFAYEC